MSIVFKKYENRYFNGLKALLHNIYNSNISEKDLMNHYVNVNKLILLAIDDVTDHVVGCSFIEERMD